MYGPPKTHIATHHKKWYQKRTGQAAIVVILLLILIGASLGYKNPTSTRSVLNTTTVLIPCQCSDAQKTWSFSLTAGKNVTIQVTLNSGDGPLLVTFSNSSHTFFAYGLTVYTAKTWDLGIQNAGTYSLMIKTDGSQTANVSVQVTQNL